MDIKKELTLEEVEDIFAARLARILVDQINDEYEAKIKREREKEISEK